MTFNISTRFLSAACAVLLVLSSAPADAAFLAGDQFAYTGALTDNGWIAHSGAGNKQIMSDGDVATLDQSSGSGEDVSLTFAPQSATQKLYASMLVNVQSGGGDPVSESPLDGNGLYFTHFKDETFGFRARTFVGLPVAGGDFTFGISADSSDLDDEGVAFGTDFSYDTWYKLVYSYDAATGASELWVDPTDESSPNITDAVGTAGTLIEAVALRQSNDYTGFIQIDDVGVGMTFMESMVPEPSSLALLALATVGCLGHRRRSLR